MDMSNKASNFDLFVLQRKYIIKGLHLTFLNIYGTYSAQTPPAWTALTLSNKGQGINGDGELRVL